MTSVVLKPWPFDTGDISAESNSVQAQENSIRDVTIESLIYSF